MSKGKNFSCNNATGKRRAADFYETPYSLTRLLLQEVKLHGTIFEPACGDGAIVKVLQEFGYTPDFSDLKNGGIPSIGISGSFLDWALHYDTIITNPPFPRRLNLSSTLKKFATNSIFCCRSHTSMAKSDSNKFGRMRNFLCEESLCLPDTLCWAIRCGRTVNAARA